MSTYVVTGHVDTVELRTASDGTWTGAVQVPAFRVTADSEAAARRLAQAIIDPLEMTTATVSVAEAEDSEDCPACNSGKLNRRAHDAGHRHRAAAQRRRGRRVMRFFMCHSGDGTTLRVRVDKIEVIKTFVDARSIPVMEVGTAGRWFEIPMTTIEQAENEAASLQAQIQGSE